MIIYCLISHEQSLLDWDSVYELLFRKASKKTCSCFFFPAGGPRWRARSCSSWLGGLLGINRSSYKNSDRNIAGSNVRHKLFCKKLNKNTEQRVSNFLAKRFRSSKSSVHYCAHWVRFAKKALFASIREPLTESESPSSWVAVMLFWRGRKKQSIDWIYFANRNHKKTSK